MKQNICTLFAIATLLPIYASAGNSNQNSHDQVSDQVIAKQRELLAKNTEGKEFGPQSPRDIDSISGNNSRSFNSAPIYTEMNLCNIHFHKNAEHKGGEFTSYAGNGDGHGYQSGYKYAGKLSAAELTQLHKEIGSGKHGGLSPVIPLRFIMFIQQLRLNLALLWERVSATQLRTLNCV